MAYSLQHQTPGQGYISWTGVTIVYDGTSYSVTDSSTWRKYAYWKLSTPTVLQVSDQYPTLGPDDALIFVNNGGVGISVLDAEVITGSIIVPGSISATALAAGCIRAEHISTGAIRAEHIDAYAIDAEKLSVNAIEAQHITAGAIEAGHITAGAIEAGHISSDAIQANHISSAAIETEHIAANAVVAGKVAADAIGANQIAANAVVAGKIATNAVDANAIQANAIVAGKIATNAVDANAVQANAITAGKIAAGAVTAETVAAGAIVAKSLTVTNFDNLWPNANSENAPPAGLTVPANDAEFDMRYNAGAGAYSGNWVRRFVSSGSQYKQLSMTLPASPGDRFYFETQYKFVTRTNGGTYAQIYVRFLNASGSSVGQTTSTNGTSSTWAPLSVASAAAPAGTVNALFVMQIDTTVSATVGEECQFDAMYARRMADANLIVDGSIIAGKIATDAVDANAIQANAITSAKINANAVVADKISAGAVTTSKLTVADFDNLWPNANSEIAIPTGVTPQNTGTATADDAEWSWIATPTGISSDTAYTGTKTRRCVAAAYSELRQTIPCAPGDRFYFEAMVKRSAGSGACRVRAAFRTAAGADTGAVLDGTNVSTSNVWEKSSLSTGAAPSDAVAIRVSLTVAAGSTADFDCMYLRRMANANLIVDGSIIAAKIATDAVTANAIQANAVVAGKIATDAVTASTISANAVTFGKVAAGAIGADQIKANAITTDKMVVTGSNLIPNFDFSTTDFTGWRQWSGTSQQSVLLGTDVSVPAGAPSRYVVKYNYAGWGGGAVSTFSHTKAYSDVGADQDGFAVVPGDQYRISVDAVKSSDLAGATSLRVYAYWYKKDNTYTTSSIPIDLLAQVTTSWATYTGIATAPTDALRCWLYVYSNGCTAGSFFWTRLRCNRMADANLIVDGSIIAGKIATDAVDAAQIKANAITAGKIATNAVTAGTIAANAVTAGTIAAGVVTATEIASNSITAKKLLIGNFDNLFDNGGFENNEAGWIATSANIETTEFYGGKQCFKETGTGAIKDHFADKYYEVTPGEIYYGEAYVKTTADSDGDKIALFFEFTDANKANATWVNVGVVNGALTSWTKKSGTVTVPAGKYFMRVGPSVRSNSTAGTAYWDNLYLRRLLDGNLILDGTLTAQKIVADTITGDKIASSTITSKNITIANLDNLWPNGNSETPQPAVYTPLAGNAEFSNLYNAGVNAYAGDWVRRFVSTTSQYVEAYHDVPAMPGEKYYMEAQYRLATKTNASTLGYLYIRFFDKTGTWIGGDSQANGGATSYTLLQKESIVAPAGTVKVRFAIGLNCTSSITAGEVAYFDAIYCRRMADANLIVDGSITSLKVQSDAIGANHIAANSILAKHLVVTGAQGMALNNDPGCGDITGWHNPPAAGSWASTVLASATNCTVQDIGTNGVVGTKCLRTTSTASTGNDFFSDLIPVDTSKIYRCHALIRGINGANGSTYIAVACVDSAGNNITHPSGNIYWWYPWAGTPTSSFVRYGQDYRFGGGTIAVQQAVDVKFPVGTKWVRIGIITRSGTVGQIEIQDLRLEETVAAELLVDGCILARTIQTGAIQTNHMTAGTINGDRITTNSLNADRIVAGSITTAQMTANSINGDRITTNTLNADRIVAGSITTAQMTANSINGDRITTNTLNADRIVAGSITTAQMTANSINGDRISTNTLNADRIVTGSITTNQMTANSINGDRITTNTLNADRIVTGSITTNQMTANSINGDRIAANTLNADRIVAGSITTDRMTANSINGDRVTANTLNADRIVAGSITTDRFTANTIDGTIITGSTISASKLNFTAAQASNIIATINASSEGALKISAAKIQIDGTTTFTSGYDPTTKATPTDVSTAQATAISTAAADATTKANNAQSTAISTAATDATTKANNAQSAAISAAAASLAQSQVRPTYFYDFGSGQNAGFTVVQSCTLADSEGGTARRITATALDPIIEKTGTFDPTKCYAIAAKVRWVSGSTWDGKLFWKNAAHSSYGTYTATCSAPPAMNQWHIVVWDMRTVASTDWLTGGNVTAIRPDFAQDNGSVVDIDWIAVGTFGAVSVADVDQAEADAIAAAATDATTKANNAQSTAISTAATDASTKATTAENNAKGYADTKDGDLIFAYNGGADRTTTTIDGAKITTGTVNAQRLGLGVTKLDRLKVTGSNNDDSRDHGVYINGVRDTTNLARGLMVYTYVRSTHALATSLATTRANAAGLAGSGWERKSFDVYGASDAAANTTRGDLATYLNSFLKTDDVVFCIYSYDAWGTHNLDGTAGTNTAGVIAALKRIGATTACELPTRARHSYALIGWPYAGEGCGLEFRGGLSSPPMSAQVTWADADLVGTTASLGANTIIEGGLIRTNTIAASKLAFTAAQASNIIATINASSEGALKISAAKIQIDGTTTFTSGYDPTTKATPADVSTAQSTAISTAATDATTKANNAQSAAISAAATDATTKATNAQNAAISAAAQADALSLIRPEIFWDFKAGDSSGFTLTNGTFSDSENGTARRVTTSAPDVQMAKTGLTLDPTKNYAISARVKWVSGGSGWAGRMYYSNGGHGSSDTYKVDVAAPPIGEWRILTWDMRAVSDFLTGGNVTAIRVDFVDTTPNVIDVDWVQIGTFGAVSAKEISDAQAAAISAAATDATTKANTAQSTAISTAATDATTKANTAQSTAISTAAADATTKAGTARTDAVSDVKGLYGHINNTTKIDGARIYTGSITADQIATQSITTSLLFANYGANLWPNGLSEVSPPANAAQSILDSAEFVFRTSGNSYSGSWKREIDNQGGIPNGGGTRRDVELRYNIMPFERFQFNAAACVVSGAGLSPAASVHITFYDETGYVLQTYNSSYVQTVTPGGIDDYQEIGTEASAPWNAFQVGFILRVATAAPGTAVAYFDDIMVTKEYIAAGTIAMYGGATSAPGWLLCDGQPRSRATYRALYNAIGETFGAGDGFTTFNVPDLRGRFPIGAGLGTGLTINRTRAVPGGSEYISVSQMPSHDHGTWTSSAGSHSHWTGLNEENIANVARYGKDTSPWESSWRKMQGTGSGYDTLTSTVGNHQHTITAQGSGAAFAPPYLAINFMIKT